MDVHLENDLSREILLHSAVTKFVLFGAISLSRNDQGVQRPDCRCLSAAKMSARYRYWSDLSRPELSLSPYFPCRPAAYALGLCRLKAPRSEFSQLWMDALFEYVIVPMLLGGQDQQLLSTQKL